ncbi:MAG: zinc ribbon domain-containing protein [Lachnospiraceae bacterium]|nr:zinc ribbon domain-containing protein [Lachnospiraceae bacterium]
MIYCSECGNPISPGQKICPNCGIQLEDDPFIFCSECGNRIESNSAICRYCGAPVLCVNAPSQVMPVQVQTVKAESSGIVVSAMIMAIFFPPLGLLLAILGLKKIQMPTNVLVCKIALVVSIITTIVYTILLVIFVPKLANIVDTAEEMTDKYNTVKEWLPFLD